MNQAPPKKDVWQTVLVSLLLLSGIGLLALGVWLAATRQEFEVLALGILAVIVPAALYGLIGAQATSHNDELAEKILAQLEQINDRILISDQAKRLAYRDKDREALRQVIIEDIKLEDYEAAMALVNELGETYGYREEAEDFHQQIVEAHAAKRIAMIQQATARIDEICERREWDLARHEAARLMRLYPEYDKIKELPTRINLARERHKAELEREFLTAAEREDLDHAMELLHEMDHYLSPAEAAPYIEIARGVITKEKENLGVRYKLAIQDKDWTQALAIGDKIIAEFPNSMFADEVRSLVDTLRERAAEEREAAVG
ncbi:MAG: hypothetical protein ACYTGQ_14940 [Planctomycetota bacterium]|jgi:hypothetical protein